MEHYNVVGHNNRNLLVQSKRLAPFHEDITKRQVFEPSSVRPGEMTKIKIDFKHAMDREIILNDIRLRFALDLSARPNVGEVYCARGTDLIRELTVKINEDVIFKADKASELTHLWLMNNHKMGGEHNHINSSFLMNHGCIPAGVAPPFFYDATTQSYLHNGKVAQFGTFTRAVQSKRGAERHDGLPRLIYSDLDPTDTTGTKYTTSNIYKFFFDISFNQLLGPVFHRLHVRRIEYIQIEMVFEPWVSQQQTQNFLLFRNNPVVDNTSTATPKPSAIHPYSVARFTDIEIRQYRTTLLDGIHGFTLPDNRMLSWLMHRYSRREYQFDFSTMKSIDIQLHDWEIRTNTVRVWWMLAPLNNASAGNGYAPYAAPCEGYDTLSGVEILWKNDEVLDLDTVHQLYRHYLMADNKRYTLEDPHLKFRRLLEAVPGATGNKINNRITRYNWNETTMNLDDSTLYDYEVPIYFVDLSMNIMQGVPGAEIIGGIVNDTSDYVIRIKRVMNDDSDRTNINLPFAHTGVRTLYVFIEYQTLVNLAAGSNQFQRGSQVVTKQLNLIN